MQTQPVVTGFRDTSEAIYYSLTSAFVRFVSFLPALIGAAIILILGWFIAGLLASLIERALKAVGFEGAVERGGIGDFIRRSGTRLTTSGVIATLIKYFIFLIFVQAAANVLGFTTKTHKRKI
jgi:uncharacterized membrane protein YeaQ/YmgE (transglycosylase-associated protein family)